MKIVIDIAKEDYEYCKHPAFSTYPISCKTIADGIPFEEAFKEALDIQEEKEL